jgi:hypothetical protein
MGRFSELTKNNTISKNSKKTYDKNANDLKNDERCKEIIEDFFNESEKTGSFINQRWTKEMLEPKSMVTGKDYKGYNILYLANRMAKDDMKDNRFFTFDHLKDVLQKKSNEFLKLKTGAEGTVIKFFRPTDAEEYYRKKLKTANETEKESIQKKYDDIKKKNELSQNRVTIVFSGYHNVFNGSQVENFDKAFPLPEKETTNKDINKDKYISYLIKAITETNDNVDYITKKDYTTIYGNLQVSGAFNRKGVGYEVDENGDMNLKKINEVHLPPKEDFKNDKHYLGALLHETSHSMIDDEVEEKTVKKLKLTEKQAYAMEEVQAELTAGMTMIRLGIDTKSDIAEENIFGTNKNYIAGWCQELKECENIKAIFESFSEESTKRSNVLIDRIKEYEKEYPFEKFLEEFKEFEKQEIENEKEKIIGEKSIEEVVEEKPQKSLIETKEKKENFEFNDNDFKVDIDRNTGIENETSKYYMVTNKKIEKFLNQNLEFNVEKVDDLGVSLKEYAKDIMIRDIQLEKESPYKVKEYDDKKFNEDVKSLKSNYKFGELSEDEVVPLNQNGIECLTQTLKDYTNEKFQLNLPTLIVTDDAINDYYRERNIEKEIDLDYENFDYPDDDLEEEFLSDFEKYEEEYIENLEKKAKIIVSRLSVSDKTFEMIENEIDEHSNKMASIKISGTENMLAIEKTAKDIGYIINATEKYDFDREQMFIKELDREKFSEKLLTNLKIQNNSFQEKMLELDYNSSVDLMSKTRDDYKENVDKYISDTSDKLVEQMFVNLKNDKVVTKEKEVNIEKSNDREIEL